MIDRTGASYLGRGRVRFRTWAPAAEKVAVVIDDGRTAMLEPGARGYHEGILEDVAPSARYRFRLDGERDRADPASRHQPDGVHGPSAVVDPAFGWTDDAWAGAPLETYVIYEVHVGTFTPEGTLDAAVDVLDDLAELGVTAVELMPLAQFPGSRNWGYDGVFPFAVQNSYGGPAAMKRFVDASHARGLAVVLDVVYNHLGPEAGHLDDFGPYYTDRYATPWGRALNFDGPDSDEVRAFFIANALSWFEEFHVDALRLDAVHAIVDTSPQPFLLELAQTAGAYSERAGRPLYLIAESDLNDPRLVTSREEGGLGLDAVWADDLHHTLHAALTGERGGYYVDYGSLDDVAGALTRGFLYAGRYSVYRRRSHGAPVGDLPGCRFVVCAQNHDQVGNRMLGERLSTLCDLDSLKLAAGVLLLSPYIPLLFMGEEYAETAPFLYFVDHSEPELIDAVRRGRAEEFAAFAWDREPPDPQDPETFRRSKLDRTRAAGGSSRLLRALYRELLMLRATVPALASLRREEATALANDQLITLRRRHEGSDVLALFNFDAEVGARGRIPDGAWRTLVDSRDERWGGPGPRTEEPVARGEIAVAPRSFVLLEKEPT